MLPKMNPKQMAQMMKQLGISSEEIDAEKVVIHRKDGTILEISKPSVVAMVMSGQKTYQVSGEEAEAGAPADAAPAEKEEDSFERDVELVMEQAKVPREQAVAALEESGGNIAEAIVKARGEDGD
ncbi:MAG: nascent polypeptide-associated complex protein [Candidatus Micrarchaeota archaeon]